MNKKTHILFVSFVFLLLFKGYAQDMNFSWAKQFGSDSYTSDLQAVTSDNKDRIFAFTHFNFTFTVDGIDYESHGENDLLLFALNEDGDVDWVVTEGGEDDEFAQLVKCDAESNVYIAGKFTNSIVINGETYMSDGLFDMYIIKYSNDGDFIWAKTFGGPNSESIMAMEIRYNSILVAGRFYNYTVIDQDTLFSQSGTDVFVARFNLEGDLQNRMTIGGNSVDNVLDLDIDAYANIYITGDFYSDIYLDEDTHFDAGDLLGVYVAKYDPAFNLKWAHQLNGNDLKPDVKLEVTPSGICAISGSFSSDIIFGMNQISTAPSDVDVYLAVFQDDGSPDWIKRYYSSSMEDIVDMGVDGEGNIYLTGQYYSSIHFDNLVLNYSLC